VVGFHDIPKGQSGVHILKLVQSIAHFHDVSFLLLYGSKCTHTDVSLFLIPGVLPRTPAREDATPSQAHRQRALWTTCIQNFVQTDLVEAKTPIFNRYLLVSPQP